MKDFNYNDLVENITSFMYDWDTYDFNDNYDSYEDGILATKDMLSSRSKTSKLLYNLKEINNDISNDDDKQIKDLYDRSNKIICDLEKYYNTLDDNYEI